MSEVGALIIKLQAETAQFREDMGKVKGDLDDLKGTSQKTGEGMAASMGEAKGGLMLVEESVGVKLPRHLNSLIATIPGVGQAFAMMLPLAGVVVAIEIVGKLIEKHDALAAATRKAAEEAENQAISGDDQVKSLQLINLKLDDQIAKLEHKPAHNFLKEAMIETSEAIDKLAAGYAPNFAKMDEYLTEHTGKWARLGRVITDAFSGQGQANGYGAVTQAMWNVQAAMEKVTEARRKMADASMDQASQTAAVANLSAALHDQLGAMDKAVSTSGQSTEALVKLKSAALATDEEMKALYLTLDNGSKHQKIAALTPTEPKPKKEKQEGVSQWVKDMIRDAELAKRLDAELSASLLQTWEQLNRADEELAHERARAEMAAAEASSRGAQQIAEQGAKLRLKAQEQHAKDQMALGHRTAAQATQDEIDASKRAVQAEVDGYKTSINNLDAADKNRLAKKIAMETQITLATQKGLADQAAIIRAAKQKEAMDIQNAENKMRESISSGIAHSIVMNKSLAASFRETGEQMAEQTIKNLLMQSFAEDKAKLISAKKAAHDSFTWASGWGGPVAGGVAAADAFASVMSFEVGGKIPGVGAVPILGHGGETVVTKALTDRVESSERNRGGMGAGPINIHFAPQIHAVDATGVDAMLSKHASVFQRHITAAMRRMNK